MNDEVSCIRVASLLAACHYSEAGILVSKKDQPFGDGLQDRRERHDVGGVHQKPTSRPCVAFVGLLIAVPEAIG